MPTPVPAPATASTQQRARIFSVGAELPSGRIADEAFLDEVARNFEANQAKGDPRFPQPTAFLIPAPSITVGHEELSSIAQQYAERTDLPALGWPTDVRREGKYLTARFNKVPVKLAEWINAGAYADISAEFYEDYEGHGPCLRRVSILGASIPNRKDLGAIPTFFFDESTENDPNPLAFVARHSERGRSYAVAFAGGHCVTFAEQAPKGQSMNPQQQQLLAALQAAFPTLDMSAVDGAALDSIMAACVAKNGDPNPPNPSDPPVNKNGEDEDEDDMAAKFAEAFKPYAKQIADMQAKLDAVRSQQQATNAQRDREAIAAFCEQHKDKIFPYELKPVDGTPSLVDELLALDNTAQVAKFTENGQIVGLSQRALAMRKITQRPIVARFAERVPNPIPDAKQVDETKRLLALTRDGQAVLKKAATK